MTHPLEQLAPYVDGTLAPAERGDVDEHLRACGQCREQVRSASAARHALRSLDTPQAPDLAAAFGPERIADHASPRAPASSPWTKVVAGLAAAAVIAAVALVVPRLGTSSGDGGTAAQGGAEAEVGVADARLRLELDDTDHDAASIEQADAGGADEELGDAEEPAVDAALAAPEQTRFAGRGRTERAIDCLRRAFPGFPGELVRVQRAAFDGAPAYLGYVLEGPGAGAPPDTLSIWVASAADCSILTISSARL